MNARYDIAIVGAGIAGASVAAMVAPHARVLLLEAEAQPGYHATGRSAAFWSQTYGGPHVQPLTSASGPWLGNPPPEFGDRSFLSPRGELFIALPEDRGELDAFVAEFVDSGIPFERIDPQGRFPGIKPEWRDAVYEPTCQDIDVGALHGAFLARARKSGAEVRTLAGLERAGGRWWLETKDGRFEADLLVNAAGAWADPVAEMAGARPLGIQPFRRTMAQLRVDPPATADLPVVRDAHDNFYFKPEAGGRLWLSPHDETPVHAHDVAPEEIDVATAIHAFHQATDWKIEAVERKWAGLRSFAPDRLPVYGFDAQVPGFFWFAGQGGFGIQTSPAAAMLAAALLLGHAPDPAVAGIDPGRYAPARFG